MSRFRVAALWWVIGVLAAGVAPLLWPSATGTAILSKAAILTLFALSYNVMLGQTGLLSFGHAVYYGVPAFACLHLVTAIGKGTAPVPLELVPLFGGIVGGGLGLVLGRIITRQSGTAFAMITLGIGELMHAAAYVFPSFFGGEQGVSTDRMVDRTLTGFTFGSNLQVYYLDLAWVALMAALLWLATRTPLGRAAVAVRENPERIRFLGYDAGTVRWLQVTIAGFAAGVAGGLFAVTYEIATAEVLSLRVSADVLVATYLGGTAVFHGPILGALLVTGFESLIGRVSEAWLLYYGALFVAVVMFVPRGLAGLGSEARKVWRRQGAGAVAIGAVAIVPGVALLAIGIVIAVETAFFLSNTFDRAAPASLAGITYDARSPLPWLTSLVFAAAGAAWLAVGRRRLPTSRAPNR